MCLAEGHNAVMRVRLKPAALQSPVKHSTTEPLRTPPPPPQKKKEEKKKRKYDTECDNNRLNYMEWSEKLQWSISFCFHTVKPVLSDN